VTAICCDLKSYYASVECVERGLDPLTTRLVVADASRTDKTICLAVSPALKSYGISGRARLFEVKQRLAEIKRSTGKEIDFIIAPPQMRKYMKISSDIYSIYLRYVAPESIHPYSIDEVFIDATSYLPLYGMTAHQLARSMIRDVLRETGITATAGIGSNLYLAKIAMDIQAKHVDADADGVRIAELDEESYKRLLWSHRPLTDFWRIGKGTARKLEENHMLTMGDIARESLINEEKLYRLFGIDAELLIDHAWGIEPTTMRDIKAYRPSANSLGSGQVLSCPYETEKAKLVVREMADQLALDLVESHLVADAVELQLGYDRISVDEGTYHGETVRDFYGRYVPKPSHGIARFDTHTSSSTLFIQRTMELFDKIVRPGVPIRRLNISAQNTIDEGDAVGQMSFFSNANDDEHEKAIQKAMLSIKHKYGKNAILKGMSYEKGATAVERNNQVGGHKA